LINKNQSIEDQFDRNFRLGILPQLLEANQAFTTIMEESENSTALMRLFFGQNDTTDVISMKGIPIAAVLAARQNMTFMDYVSL
jgi:hypothetical protein